LQYACERLLSFLIWNAVMSLDEIDLRPARFATGEFPRRDRLNRWRDKSGRTIVSGDIVPTGAGRSVTRRSHAVAIAGRARSRRNPASATGIDARYKG
jgi:hypothetical protein